MKSKNSILTFLILLISVFLLFQSCEETIIKNKSEKVQKSTDSLVSFLPKQKYLNIDSLLVRVPGVDGVKQYEKISSDLPKPQEYIGIREVVPGESYLSQTIDEKLARKMPLKSKKPEIIRVDNTKLKKRAITPDNPAIITVISKGIDIARDSISYYEDMVIKRGLVSIQNKDSIFPPFSYPAGKVKRTRALPFRYKDQVVFDISILDADQGLPFPFVRAIAKDKNGQIWFASHTGGLISYDGYYFDTYGGDNTTRELARALLIDQKGNIWTGTNKGAIYFDGKKNTRYTKRQGLPSNEILAIIEDSNNNIWFATNEGVSCFDGETFSTLTTDQGLALNYVFSLFEDNKGNIWFGTFGGGVTKYDGETLTTFTKDDGLALNKVLSISQDHLGNLWFGTYGRGVSKFDGDTFTNYSSEQGMAGNVILSILEDANNDIWFGTYGEGITCFNGRSFSNYTTKEGLSDNYIRALFEDGTGNIWLGSDVSLSKFNKNSFSHYTKAQGLNNNLITSIFQDHKGRLWLAPYENGVSIFSEPDNLGEESVFTQITTDQGLAHNIVNSIIQDNQNNFWFATFGGGVSKLDGSSFEKGKLKFTNYSTEQGLSGNFVKVVMQDKDGNLWFGTDGGVTKFDGSEFVSITAKDGLGDGYVLSVFQDDSDAFWFGTLAGGVSRFKNDTLICYTTEHGLGNNTVWTMTQDHNGVMWFGTDGGGLSYFNGHSFSTLKTEDGLCNDNIFSLINDTDNSLWVGTLKGLSQIKLPDIIRSGKDSIVYDKLVIINYGKNDGLKGLDFYTNSGLLDNNNCLWWGTERALTMLNLKTFKPAEELPVVFLDGIIINDQTIDFNELMLNDQNYQSGIRFIDVLPFSNNPIKLSLSYDLNHITFNFTATDWSTPSQIQFKYKLLGLDQKWSLITKDNIADYRNIPPGNYTFLVKAMGKSGKWSDEFEYPFVVRWPFWLSWWAIMFYVITFVFIILLIIRWRVNIIKKQKTVLESMVARRTKDLDKALLLAEQATNAKGQFLATITHEIRTPLNAIMGLTHLALENTPNTKQEDYLQKIDRSANTMLSLINDILDFSKIEVGKMQLESIPFDIEIVMNSVIILNAHHAREKNLEFVINIDSRIPGMLIGDPLRIGQVITNFCSNAIKFTASGEVVIDIELAEKTDENEIILQIAVKDTGIGIKKEQIPFLFDEFEQADNSITRKYGGTGLGLSISKLLIDMMGGHIWLNSEPGKGTTFFFDCKLGVQTNEESIVNYNLEDLKQINILVCDDKPSALDAINRILNSFSINVDAVSSGEEVLKQIKKKPYDLLIIDQQLSGINGIDTITEINNNSDLLPIKTILMTNSDSSTKGVDSDFAGVNGYLSKPVLPSIVIDELLTVFGFEKKTPQQKDDKKTRLNQIKKVVSDCSILIVEDNELNMQVIIELIDRVGVKIELAVNGAEAVEKALANNYDLIFMDLHMPVMDGYNATKEIRKCNINIPIIATTADASEDIKVKCNTVGVDDIITKPIDPDLLYDILLKWLNHKETNNNDIIKPADVINAVISKISISDLDMKSSIRRFGDNEELYLKMLRKFISNNKRTCLQLNGLMEKEEFEEAHLLIHTLKGESANIGANKVHMISKHVEQMVLNKDLIGFEIELGLLKRSLENLTSELQCYFQDNSHNNKKEETSLQEQIIELTKYLKIRDPKAFDLLDKLNESNIEMPELNAINKAVNSGNLDEAFALLKKLSEN